MFRFWERTIRENIYTVRERICSKTADFAYIVFAKNRMPNANSNPPKFRGSRSRTVYICLQTVILVVAYHLRKSSSAKNRPRLQTAGVLSANGVPFAKGMLFFLIRDDAVREQDFFAGGR